MKFAKERWKFVFEIEMLDDLLAHDSPKRIIWPWKIAASEIYIAVGPEKVDIEPSIYSPTSTTEMEQVGRRLAERTEIQKAGAKTQQVHAQTLPRSSGQQAARPQGTK